MFIITTLNEYVYAYAANSLKKHEICPKLTKTPE